MPTVFDCIAELFGTSSELIQARGAARRVFEARLIDLVYGTVVPRVLEVEAALGMLVLAYKENRPASEEFCPLDEGTYLLYAQWIYQKTQSPEVESWLECEYGDQIDVIQKCAFEELLNDGKVIPLIKTR